MLIIKEYSDQILSDINFRLNRGENLVILGSNGAGKSTLAKLLCGIRYSKSVDIDNDKLHLLSSRVRSQKINYLPPRLEIFDEYITVKDFLQLSKLYGHISVNEAIMQLELTKIKNSSCKTLSSGEQQRVLLASSLLHRAEITIYDEPTANLDPNYTLKVFEILKSDKIGSRIIITHDLNLAFRLGYRVIYMTQGRVIYDGENENFFNQFILQKFFGDSIKRVDDYFVVNI